MTRQQYLDSLVQLGLTQSSCARFLGNNVRTASRWATGKSPVPHVVALLFKAMLIHNIKPKDLA